MIYKGRELITLFYLWFKMAGKLSRSSGSQQNELQKPFFREAVLMFNEEGFFWLSWKVKCFSEKKAITEVQVFGALLRKEYVSPKTEFQLTTSVLNQKKSSLHRVPYLELERGKSAGYNGFLNVTRCLLFIVWNKVLIVFPMELT